MDTLAANDLYNEKKMSQVVIEQIQTMIMNGELKAGDRLPPEREMTEHFNIGRPALREALKALEVLGLIERRHGLGNYITNDVGNNFFKPLSLSFKLSNGNVHDIMELRQLIESYTVRRAAENATEEDIQRLLNIHHHIIDAETPEEKVMWDKNFHFEIANICGNMLVKTTFENASYLLDSFIDQTVRMWYFGEDTRDRVYREHLDIIDAIRRHDGHLATACMAVHMGNIDQNLLHDI